MEDFMKEYIFISCLVQVYLYNLYMEDFMKEYISYLV